LRSIHFHENATAAAAAASHGDVRIAKEKTAMYSRDIVGIVITCVIMICVFTFITVHAWAEQRKREREAFYRSEVLKKLAESPAAQVQQVLDVMREQDRNEERQRREGGKLAGLIVTAVGIGLSVMFALLAPGGVWAIGLIPLLVGLALLIHNYVLAPRTPN
jgi:Flp pilus assembly protein TadB